MVPATPQNDPDTIELLRTFQKLPRLLQGKQVEITFSSFRFSRAAAEDCGALRLTIGATVYSQVELSDTGKEKETISVYASDQLAIDLAKLKNGDVARVRGVTVFGVVKNIEHAYNMEDDQITQEPVYGIQVKEILT